MAVRCGERALTYAALDGAANVLAHRLCDVGVCEGSVVGVRLERDVDVPVAVLGILRCGAAYLPLDPAYPEERLEFMIQDAGARPIVGADGLAVDCDARRADPPSAERDPNALAYVIHTSGSTGRPKGVEVRHRGLSNLVRSIVERPGLREDDVFAAVTTLSFDIAALELLAPLTVGATVDIVERQVSTDGAALARRLAGSGATVMQATPATWRLLLEAGWTASRGFRALCGGETLTVDLATRLIDAGCELWNLYGPTETTIWSTAAQVTRETLERGSDIPIGRPLHNTSVHVLDPGGRLAPPGTPGELYIGGDGVARGYRDRAERTEERFVPDPFASAATARMYRTGDLVRFDRDGVLHYLGRMDDQVKLRGHRIELGEIEAALTSSDSIAQSVVALHTDTSEGPRLDAYVVLARSEVDAGELRAHLQRLLPPVMVPSTFTLLEALPLTANGKVDRRALPAPDRAPLRTSPPPTSEPAATIAAIFGELLGMDPLGADDSFFDHGGHSLLAARACSRLAERLGAEVELRLVFEHPTPASLAARLPGRRPGRSKPAITLLARPGEGKVE